MEIFNPNEVNYKQYMFENYGLLESPARFRNLDYTRNKLDVNALEAKNIIQNDEFIGIYKFNSFNTNLFYSKEGNIIFYNLLQQDNNYILMHHSFEEISLNNKIGIVSLDIWNFKSAKGLARYWIFDFILNKYDFIVSDNLHTPKGEEFWKKLINEALNDNYICGGINLNTNEFIRINSLNDVLQFYNNKKQYRLIIYKKQFDL